MNSQQIDLTPLKGLHLIDQPSWWPLAYGWWVILTIIAVIGICVFLFHKWWINRPIVYVSREIKHIQLQKLSDLDFLHALSDLMKRVAILKFGREAISPLTEDKWQQFLIKTVPHIFSKNDAKLIAFSPYLTKISHAIDRPLFANQVQTWIRQALKK